MDSTDDKELREIASILISRFLDSAPLAGGDLDERSLVARFCADSISVFRIIIRQLQTSKVKGTASRDREVYTSIQRSFSRLLLWSDGYGVATGKLDSVFAKAQGLRQATLQILAAISQTLTERLVPLTNIRTHMNPQEMESLQQLRTLTEAAVDGQYDQDSSVDSGSDYGCDSIRDIGEDLKTDTMCLMDLDPLIRNPVLDREWEISAPGVASSSREWVPHGAYSNKIRSRFPKANDSLISRLGRANFARFLRCQQKRSENADSEPSAENLKTAQKAISEGYSLRDSGLGSSLPTSYAETVMSYHAEPGNSVRVPPLPPQAKAGSPFPCVACGGMVHILTNSAWKAHLYEDLRPWLCLDNPCSLGDNAFSGRQDWISHLALDHGMEPKWESMECPLCLADTGTGKTCILKHLGGHLEEISLAAIPSDPDFDTESEDEGSTGARDNEFKANLEAEEISQDDSHKLADSTPERMLNDALAYLDKIRKEFPEEPEKYNAFLEIMIDFKSQKINTAQTAQRVVELFEGYPNLTMGFNTFLPPGFYINEDLSLKTPKLP